MKMRKVISTVLAGVLALSALPISAMSAGAEEHMRRAMWIWMVLSPGMMQQWFPDIST